MRIYTYYMKCYRCKKEKEPAEFYKDAGRSTGYMSKCKPCCKQVVMERRKTPNGKAKLVIASRVWKRNNKIKERAHKAVARALAKNLITKPSTCTNCPSSERIEGHHENYEKQLDVIWLCQKCHNNLHREKQRAPR